MRAIRVAEGFVLAALGFFGRGMIDGGGAPASAPRAAAPALEMHYAPDEDLERIDVGLIEGAGETIDIAAYVLTDGPVIDALAEAAQRGVRIRLYRWPEEWESAPRTAAALAALAAEPGVTQRFKRGPDLMHLKSYCVDGATLRGGAANFSASGLKRQDNDLTILRGPQACARFEAAFAAMWGE